jgi:hypothetical protein
MAKLESVLSPLLHFIFEIYPSLKVINKYACRGRKEFNCSESVLTYQYKIAKDLKFYLNQIGSTYEEETKQNWDYDIILINNLYELDKWIDEFITASDSSETNFSHIYYAVSRILRKYLQKVKSERNENLYFKCEGKGIFENEPNLGKSYFMLRLAQNFIIPFVDVLTALEHIFKNEDHHFLLLPKRDDEGQQLKLNLTSNYELTVPEQSRRASYISADHCQPGTNKLVYTLVVKKRAP